MGKTKDANHFFGGHRAILVIALCLLALSASWAAKRKTTRKKTDDRVYLVHADRLRYDQSKTWGPEAMNGQAPQILNGHVQFKHKGATLFCDSAYFYEAFNSFKAFGHVKMLQGDTLSLTSEYAYYDGNDEMAEARRNVVLKHRKQTLYTDSLNFDRLYGIGYFFEGGKLVDQGSTLTSDWGQYNTETKKAVFNYNVKLRNKQFTMTTDTLHYDTRVSLAQIVGPTDIYQNNSHIYTERGFYDTKREQARLMDRSVLRNNGKMMIGDSVYYDSKKGFSEAFRNVIYVDTLNKTKMTGNYCMNNDETGFSMTTDSAMVMDFSQKDTLFMHADTFKVFTYNQNTDSVYRMIHAYNKVRAYRTDAQFVCDSLVYSSRDSCITLHRDPIAWNLNQQLTGEEIRVYLNDSTIDWAHVIAQAFSIEQNRDSVHYNQVSSKDMKVYFDKGKARMAEAIGNVLLDFYPIDDSDSTLTMLIYAESDTLRMFLNEGKLDHIWMPKTNGTCYPMTQIPADKAELPGFQWFDYIRPLSKGDCFVWRGKAKGTEIKPEARRQAPRQRLGGGDSSQSPASDRQRQDGQQEQYQQPGQDSQKQKPQGVRKAKDEERI